MDTLIIKGARQHNLKNISLELPKNKLVVFTGVSGSGKSSLAFDTIYAEGQRRYVESLSSYARQFLGIMDKPDVDSIEGLSPSISIDQKSTSHNPRSTVGTVTEIYDYLRLLFARVGHPHCSICGREVSRLSPQQIVDQLLELARAELSSGKKMVRMLILSPIVRDRKGEFVHLFDNIRTKGYRQVRVDGYFFGINEDIGLIKTNKHTVDAVIDRFTIDALQLKKLTGKAETSDPYTQLRSRVADSVEQALTLSDGLVTGVVVNDAGFVFPEKPKELSEHIFSEKFACPVCNISLPEIEPRSFSFNSPHGACEECSGIGTVLTVDAQLIISPELSMTEGGILPFARTFMHDTWYSRVVMKVAEDHGINPRAPLNKMTEAQKKVLLYGTGDKQYRVEGTNRFGAKTTIEEQFIGIVPELKKRLSETESEFVRGEIEKYMRRETCPSCNGKRLKKDTLTVTIDKFSIADVTDLSISDAIVWVKSLESGDRALTNFQEQQVSKPIIKEIISRLTFLERVGLEYLSLGRSAATLAGGEAQRIRLASQIGSGLSGVLYVLDEPSIGLHPRDNTKLIKTLHALRDLGNSVIVVEHDKEMMEESDYLVDFGPGAGEHGGNIIAQGTLAEVLANKHSITGPYITEKKKINRPSVTVKQDEDKGSVILRGASENNLKHIDVTFPLGKFICITGVSGSGKSTLIVETFYRALAQKVNPLVKERPGAHDSIENTEKIDKTILIDQSPIGRTPRSNPATYTGIFSQIRDLFALTSEARTRGYKSGRFSFNVKGGRCEACEGEGQRKIEMQFLSDVYVTCEVCHGSRYNAETLEVLYRDKNIAQVLNMTVEEAVSFFSHHPLLSEKLAVIKEVGLSYMHLGQPATTLSGGEAQRVKLATELHRRQTGHTMYILDEPTTGLHFADLEKLLHVLHKLTVLGNTVVVIEHNLDIIKNADWIIDMGPEGGDGGGRVIATGTPVDIAKIANSSTGQFLKNILK